MATAKHAPRQENLASDFEALIDLFMSSDFQPLEEKSSQPNLRKYTFESAFASDDEEDSYGNHHSLPPFEHNKYFLTKVGRVLAKCGDEFYNAHTPPEERGMGTPWFGVADQLKKVFLNYATVKKNAKDPEKAKEEEEKAYETFKGIMSNAVKDTGVSDGYKQLGAVLLTVHGLSELQAGVRGTAQSFFNRYMRERQMDEAVLRIGGLDGLMERELD